MKIFILLIMTTIVSGCCILTTGMKSRLLGDRITEVPFNVSVYANKSKFDSTILAIIDTSVIYEGYDAYNQVLEREDYFYGRSNYSFIRFYPNGYFNSFLGDQGRELSIKYVDPEYTGWRGVYYRDGDKIRFDEFTAVSECYELGKFTGVFTTKGDTLYMKYKVGKYPQIYVKRRIEDELMQFKADW